MTTFQHFKQSWLESLAKIESKHDTYSTIDYDDLEMIMRNMDYLGYNSFLGRTAQSFKDEHGYLAKTFFNQEKEIRIHRGLRQSYSASRPFGVTSQIDQLDRTYATVAFVLASFNRMRELRITLETDSFSGVTNSDIISSIHLSERSAYVAHAMYIRKDYPFAEISHSAYRSGTGYSEQRIRRYDEYMSATLAHPESMRVWFALERVWCELLLRRPKPRALIRASVDTRVRVLQNQVVRVQTANGIYVGRCPGLQELMKTGSIALYDDWGFRSIEPSNVLEISPWRMDFGSGLIVS